MIIPLQDSHRFRITAVPIHFQARDTAFFRSVLVVLEVKLTPSLREKKGICIEALACRHNNIELRSARRRPFAALNRPKPLLPMEALNSIPKIDNPTFREETKHLVIVGCAVDWLLIVIHFIVGIELGYRIPPEGV